jgi:hypothetical protein
MSALRASIESWHSPASITIVVTKTKYYLINTILSGVEALPSAQELCDYSLKLFKIREKPPKNL